MVMIMDVMEQELPENYKQKYRELKKKLKFLIYENECFQDELRKAQRKLLKVNRDKSFLLDRLLQYEKPEASSSDSDATDSSDGEFEVPKAEAGKKRKLDSSQHAVFTSSKAQNTALKKRKSTPKAKQTQPLPPPAESNTTLRAPSSLPPSLTTPSDGHMTPEEVERHLESKQSYMNLLPEKAPLTVPYELFSNEASLDSESNEIMEEEMSPRSSNIGEDVSVDVPE